MIPDVKLQQSLEVLATSARTDRRAMGELVERLNKALWKVAMQYRNWLDPEDGYAEACLSLYDAVRCYDRTKGRFLAYAWWWMESRVGRASWAARQGGFTGVGAAGRKVTRLVETLPMTYEQAALRVGVTTTDAHWRVLATRAYSLNQTVSRTGGSTARHISLVDTIASSDTWPDAALLETEVLEVLKNMKPHLLEVLVRVEALDETLQQVGARYGVSVERARQLKNQALQQARREVENELRRS